MTGRVVKPFAKINLFLKIRRKREDGYHDIDTVFQTIDLADRMEIESRGSGIILECNRRDIPTDEKNLVVRTVLHLRKAEYPVPDLNMKLRKSIPTGSGLGGGSSDAAALIMGLNGMLELGMSQQQMSDVASRIGSDVAFFLWGGTAVGHGRGEKIFPLAQLPDFWVALATSDIKIDTPRAYSKIDALLTEKENNNNITQFIYSIFKGKPDFSLAENDFERLVLEEHGELKEIRTIFKEKGAVSALLTGSGSAFYGLFLRRQDAEKAALAVNKMRLCRDCMVCRTMDSLRYHKQLFDRTNLE